METLPMFEEDWVQTLVDAANGEGQFNEESEPIETVSLRVPFKLPRVVFVMTHYLRAQKFPPRSQTLPRRREWREGR